MTDLDLADLREKAEAARDNPDGIEWFRFWDGITENNILELLDRLERAEAKTPTGWSDEDAREAFDQADDRFGGWRGGDRHEYAEGCYNGFSLGAEWQKSRETFISYKAIADEAKERAERAEAERDELGRAAFATVQESGVDTDGATDWESHFRPLKYPTWEEHVRDSVRYLRGED